MSASEGSPGRDATWPQQPTALQVRGILVKCVCERHRDRAPRSPAPAPPRPVRPADRAASAAAFSVVLGPSFSCSAAANGDGGAKRKDPGRISDHDDNFNQDKTLQRSRSAPPPITIIPSLCGEVPIHALPVQERAFSSVRWRTTVAPGPLRSSAVAVAVTGAREGAAGIPSPSSPACPLPGKSGRGARPPCAPSGNVGGARARLAVARGPAWRALVHHQVGRSDRWKGAHIFRGGRRRTRPRAAAIAFASRSSAGMRRSLNSGPGTATIDRGRVGTQVAVASSDDEPAMGHRHRHRAGRSREDATRSHGEREQEQADLSAAGLAISRLQGWIGRAGIIFGRESESRASRQPMWGSA
jgi:hypothetical protein